ncbi:NAD(P)-dependent oxidoreductase [Demequina sp. NBRC 110054]|uniref:NAD(P)-dependent oxidoreductase n=1 Tax=Demequina sp. NBRC 110054 TaxID=1570343 RepID=UPI000A035310|nr:NAD(P)-dependent oxidoreductase [Demequina sp. NBRC 110054]
MTAQGRIALIGLGEVGRVFVEDLRAVGRGDIAAWDTAFADPDSKASVNARELGVTPASSMDDAVAGAALVVSAVTASNSVAAAEAAAPAMEPGAFLFDLNSSSPGHKQAARDAVESHGGRYVEAALMSPIGPKRLASPFLLGGAHASAFLGIADGYGITGVTALGGEVGVAAATKLCRSVIVKGLEALLTESLLAARTFGVERDVLDSLPNILPPADWEKVAGYFMSRAVQHGTRRAEEMEEAAATVAEAGVEPYMARATVERQRWSAQFCDVLPQETTMGLVDALLAASGIHLTTGEDATAIDATAAPDTIQEAPR